MEIIKELEKMVAELLQVFARGCGNRLPTKIVFYRDGVDEGQYQKVLDHEVTKIKAACRSTTSKSIILKIIIIFPL
jgi:eukaryotic translation initiation factor 2C